TQLDQPAVGFDGHVANVVFACELAADAHEYPVAVRVDRAARHHAVLVLQAVDDRLRSDTQRSQTLVGEFDVHALFLLAEDVDFIDHRYLQQSAFDVFSDVRNLSVSDAITLDGV